MRKGICLALHPLFLLSLAILFINDHILKNLYPGFVTGKLSDFAGLFLFPVFLYILFEGFFRNKKRLIFMHVLMGLAFIVWKLAPVEILLAKINELTSIPMPGRVKDLTDLAALSVLPFSYYIICRNKNITLPAMRKTRLALSNIIIVIAAVSMMATTPVYHYKSKPEIQFNLTNKSAMAALIDFEYTLKENEFKIVDKKTDGDIVTYFTETWLFYDRSLTYCEIELIVRNSEPAIIIRDVNLRSTDINIEESAAERFISEKIIKPFERLLNQ